MKLVRELRLFILQDVFHTNRQKHSIIESITKEQVFFNFRMTGFFLQLCLSVNDVMGLGLMILWPVLLIVIHRKAITKKIIVVFQVCEFAKAFCQSNLFVQGLVQGNVTQDEAIHLYKNSRYI